MQRYIAFLRAINVGGHTVKMERLRALFEALEFANVATFIASGNVIFESPVAQAPKLERQIERHLKESLGYEVATFIRSDVQLTEVAAYEPFDAGDLGEGSALFVAFLHTPPTAEARKKLMAFRTEIDDFDVHDREVYWLRRARVSESSFSGALLEKSLGLPATMRNISTVRKLAAKYPSPS